MLGIKVAGEGDIEVKWLFVSMGADVGVGLEEGCDGFGKGDVAEFEFGDVEVLELFASVVASVGEVGGRLNG